MSNHPDDDLNKLANHNYLGWQTVKTKTTWTIDRSIENLLLPRKFRLALSRPAILVPFSQAICNREGVPTLFFMIEESMSLNFVASPCVRHRHNIWKNLHLFLPIHDGPSIS